MLVIYQSFLPPLQHIAPKVKLNAVPQYNAVVGTETEIPAPQFTAMQMQWSMNEAL